MTIFPFVFTGLVLFFMVWNIILVRSELRSGIARLHVWPSGQKIMRDEEPSQFWFAVSTKLIVIPVGLAMLWMSSDMFWGH